MKFFIPIIVLIILNTALANEFQLSSTILNGENESFLEHKGDGKWDNYLTVNLPFKPMADLFKQLLIYKKSSLTSRGEAHITIITPVEYWNVLKPAGITIDEIIEMAKSSNIQKISFQIECLGRGRAKIKNTIEETYYVVVNSKELVQFRKQVQDLFISKGGDPNMFNPKNYYPHITLGFTKRDLHESDGIKKDKNSCPKEFQLSVFTQQP